MKYRCSPSCGSSSAAAHCIYKKDGYRKIPAFFIDSDLSVGQPLPREADLLQDDGELIILRVSPDDDMLLEPIEDEDEFDEIGRQFEERLSELYDFEDDGE